MPGAIHQPYDDRAIIVKHNIAQDRLGIDDLFVIGKVTGVSELHHTGTE